MISPISIYSASNQQLRRSKSSSICINKTIDAKKIKNFYIKTNKQNTESSFIIEGNSPQKNSCDKKKNQITKIKEKDQNLTSNTSHVSKVTELSNKLISQSILDNISLHLFPNIKFTFIRSKILEIVYTKQGSKLLQSSLFKLSKESVDFIYEEIKHELTNLICDTISNFFIFKLFSKLERQKRMDYLMIIFSNLNYIKNNINGKQSLVYLIESELSLEEERLIVDSINKIKDFSITNKNFIRIVESVVCCFQYDIIEELIYFYINYFHDLIKIREGYFLLRVIVKRAKSNDIQEIIIHEILKNFEITILSVNGSLICQCIMYNFPILKYHPIRSNSYISDMNNIEELDYKDPINKNKNVKKIIKRMFNHLSLWDKTNIIPLVECMIRIAPIDYLYYFKKYTQNPKFLSSFLNLATSNQILDYIIQYYDKSCIGEVMTTCQKFITKNNLKIQNYKELFKNFKIESKPRISKQSKDSNLTNFQSMISSNYQFPISNPNIIFVSSNINNNLSNFPLYYPNYQMPVIYYNNN